MQWTFSTMRRYLEAQSIMGRPGGKTKTKKMAETRRTREQLKTWTVPQLSRYLKDRGVAAGKKFFYASLLGLEVLPNENQVIDNIAQRRKEKLTLDGVLHTPEYLSDTTYCDLE